MKKKTLLIVLVATLFVAMVALTNSVQAASGDATTTVTKIEALTGGTFDKEVTSNPASPVTLTLSADEIKALKWYDKDDPTYQDGLVRPSSGWWIGFRLTFSEDVSTDTNKKVSATYTDYTGAVKGPQEISLDKDQTSVYTCWLGIDKNKVEGKTGEVRIGTFKYTNASGLDYTVIVKVKEAEKIVFTPDERAIEVKVGSHVFTMLKGKSLKEGLTEIEMKELEALLTKEGYSFIGLYKKGTETEVSLTDKLSEDTELEIRFKKLPENKPAEKKKDPTPNTGVNVYAVAGAILVVSTLGVIVLNKRK